MTIMDKIDAQAHTIVNRLFDRELLNYTEAANLYSFVSQGYLNKSILTVMHNQARDPALKKLIRRAIEEQNEAVIVQAAKWLDAKNAEVPANQQPQRQLHEEPLSLPLDASLTDAELAMALAMMAKAAQQTMLMAMQTAYQPELINMYRKHLDSGFDFSYRIIKLALDRGWLPYQAKIEH